jgi:hypothetical protein
VKLQLAENQITLRLDSEVDEEVAEEADEEEGGGGEEEEEEGKKAKKAKKKARGKKAKAKAPYVDVVIDLALSAFANSSTCVECIYKLAIV